ncbi:hypothetical protein JCGZ_18564 [Jatropha curcas]|uniref:Uncharacterized protein n=1 Tax=Jatropha curcas TaxID=180498 RepID=A0A067KE02_JATCU|nr:hypothetical protein JCGZ_18564 [Jatropha curcas]
MLHQLLNGLSWDQIHLAGAGHHLAAFVTGAYAIFVQTQLLVHIPPPTEFDPFAGMQQQRVKCVRGGSGSRALDTAIVVSMLERKPGASFSFILDHTGQIAQGMLETHLLSPYRMSPPGCTHRAGMAPPASRGRQAQHGGRAGCRVRPMQVIIKEAKETSSDDSKETASNMS